MDPLEFSEVIGPADILDGLAFAECPDGAQVHFQQAHDAARV